MEKLDFRHMPLEKAEIKTVEVKKLEPIKAEEKQVFGKKYGLFDKLTYK